MGNSQLAMFDCRRVVGLGFKIPWNQVGDFIAFQWWDFKYKTIGMVGRFQHEQSGCDKESKMMVYAMNMVVLPAEMVV